MVIRNTKISLTDYSFFPLYFFPFEFYVYKHPLHTSSSLGCFSLIVNYSVPARKNPGHNSLFPILQVFELKFCL